jgi:RNA polymerase sigma-70 factor (ECF subfamily)
MLQARVPDLAVSDEALVARARRGASGAFEELVTRYQGRIHRFAFRMCRNADDAEEITQEAFLHAYRGLGSFAGDARFGTWLYRIAMNEALMRRRAARRRPTQSIEELTARKGDSFLGAPVAAADDLLGEKGLAERVQEALARLDEPHRAALVLRDLEELSSEEAADILGISPDAVRQRVHRARMQLRAMLGPVEPLASG